MSTMKTSKFILFILIYPISVTSPAISQVTDGERLSAESAAKELLMVSEAYAALESYSVKISHRFYKNYSAATPEYSYDGFYRKYKSCYHSQLLGITTLQDEKKKITIDTADRLMILSNPSRITAGTFSMQEYAGILKKSSSISRTKKSGFIVYRLSFLQPGAEVSAMEMHINNKHLLVKLVIFYNQTRTTNEDGVVSTIEKPRTEILYEDYKLNLKFNSREFAGLRYLELYNGSLRPTAGFRQYRFINQQY